MQNYHRGINRTAWRGSKTVGAVFLRARQMIADVPMVTELTIGEHDIRTDAPILQDNCPVERWPVTQAMRIPGTPTCACCVPRGCKNAPVSPQRAIMWLITRWAKCAVAGAYGDLQSPPIRALYNRSVLCHLPRTIRGVSAYPCRFFAQCR